MINKKGLAKIILLGIYLICTASLFAYQISPLSATFQSSGVEATKAYTLTNDSDSPIAIEVKAYKRFIDENGEEYMEEAPAFFSIQPNKMIIKPQSSQIVRVQYRGPRTVTKEMAFRVVAEQIAYSQGAKSEENTQMINFLFVYNTSAYVAPTKVLERVSATAVKTSSDGIAITLSNTGSVHQVLNNLSIKLVGDNGAEYTLTSEEIGNKSGINLLVDSAVNITIPTPDVLSNANSFNVVTDYSFNY